jgi:mercuric ion binding protein
MKKILFWTLLGTLSYTTTDAQSKKGIVTETIYVDGVCSSCKKRIEDAAYIPGVKHAEWDKDKNILTVSYKADKVTLETISKAVAEKGHNAGDVKADRSTYEKLPKCCAYESNHKH